MNPHIVAFAKKTKRVLVATDAGLKWVDAKPFHLKWPGWADRVVDETESGAYAKVIQGSK